MKNEFIETANVNKFNNICAELEDPVSMIGPSLSMVTGPAGRGKSEAAKRYAVQGSAIYIPPMNIRSPAMVLREITFELCKMRPGRADTCLAMIGAEMAKDRRLVIIDEADLLSMYVLEMLRNVNERFSCPIILIGEEELKGKIASRRRIKSRIRRHMDFLPVTQPDIAYFFSQCLGMKISPDIGAAIQRHCEGDWRPVLTTAIAIERAMIASGMDEITLELVKDAIKNA